MSGRWIDSSILSNKGVAWVDGGVERVESKGKVLDFLVHQRSSPQLLFVNMSHD